MAEMKNHQKSRRNAQNTRQVILNAAEKVFAEHGFDGARIDVIASESGYNQGLIFRYFSDKQGLYAEVLKRIDQQAIDLQGKLLSPLLEDQAILSDKKRFRAFLANAFSAFLDFMLENPRLTRMIVWENAENWRTYTKMPGLFKLEGLDQVVTLFGKAHQAGLLRSNADPFLPFILAEQICWTYASSLPFYEMVMPGTDLSSVEAKATARQQIIEFIIAGILIDSTDEKTPV